MYIVGENIICVPKILFSIAPCKVFDLIPLVYFFVPVLFLIAPSQAIAISTIAIAKRFRLLIAITKSDNDIRI